MEKNKENFCKCEMWMLEEKLTLSELKALLIIQKNTWNGKHKEVKITFSEFLNRGISRSNIKKAINKLNDYGFIGIKGKNLYSMTGNTQKIIVEKTLSYEEVVKEHKKLFESIVWKEKDVLSKNEHQEWIEKGLHKDFAVDILEDLKKYK